MKITGKILEIRPSMDKDGKQRTFNTQDGKVMECWEVAIDHPSVGANGKEYSEQFVGELYREVKPDNGKVGEGYVGTGLLYDINLYFSRREYQGRWFQSIRVGNISQKVM